LGPRPPRLAAGARSRDLDERHGGIDGRERACPASREVVGQARVFGLAQAGGGDTEAEKARVVASQLRAGGEVEEILEDQLAQLRMCPAGRAAADRQHALDAVIEQALAQDSLSHHTGRAEEDDLHDRLILSLIWSPAAS